MLELYSFGDGGSTLIKTFSCAHGTSCMRCSQPVDKTFSYERDGLAQQSRPVLVLSLDLYRALLYLASSGYQFTIELAFSL